MKSKSLHTLILGILLPVLWITATNSASGQQLIPQPNQVTRHEGAFTITSQTVLVTHEFKDLANYLNDHIEQLCGFRLAVVTLAPDTNYISLRKNQHLTNTGAARRRLPDASVWGCISPRSSQSCSPAR